MTSDEVTNLIETDSDYVYLKRFDFSLNKLLERYPEGVPVRIIAQALFMTEEEVEATYESIVVKLRRFMGVEEDAV